MLKEPKGYTPALYYLFTFLSFFRSNFIVLKQFFIVLLDLGSILPTLYVQFLQVQIPKSQKDSQVISAF
jgi:hypothetical protein